MQVQQTTEVCVVNQSDLDTIPPFLVRLRLINYQTTCGADAMIDSGAECNLLSHKTWETLGQPTLTPSTLSLIDFKGERSKALGEILLRVLECVFWSSPHVWTSYVFASLSHVVTCSYFGLLSFGSWEHGLCPLVTAITQRSLSTWVSIYTWPPSLSFLVESIVSL